MGSTQRINKHKKQGETRATRRMTQHKQIRRPIRDEKQNAGMEVKTGEIIAVALKKSPTEEHLNSCRQKAKGSL